MVDGTGRSGPRPIAIIDGAAPEAPLSPKALQLIRKALAERIDRNEAAQNHTENSNIQRSASVRILQAPGDEDCFLVQENVADGDFERLMRRPFVGLIETTPDITAHSIMPRVFSPSVLTAAASRRMPPLFFSLTSISALSTNAYLYIAQFIGQVAELNESEVEDLATILRELIVNAVVHGNFGLALKSGGGIDDYAAFAEQIEAHKNDPKFCQKRVWVSVVTLVGDVSVSVQDEGEGFNLSDILQPSQNLAHHGASGRGLAIASELSRSLWTEEERSAVCFRLVGRAEQEASFEQEEEALRVSLLRVVRDSVIVIADDQDIPLTLLEMFLEAGGYNNVISAQDGDEALAAILEHDADLAILDHQMPTVSGFDVIEQLRSKTKTRRLPVIVVSATGTTEFRNKALSVGATDVLTKPVVQELLLDRVRLHLENRMMMRELSTYRRRVGEELDAARRMQEGLFPASDDVDAIANRYGVRIWSHHRSSSELGGDLWRIDPIDDTMFSVWMIDFTGHGVGSALNTFRFHTLLSDMALSHLSPEAAIAAVNRRLTDLLPRGQFATALYARIDTKQRRVEYTSAGAPEPFKGRWGEHEVEVLESKGLPLGISKSATYRTWSMDLMEGAYLFLASDALVECETIDGGPPLEIEGAVEMIGAVAALPDDRETRSPMGRLLTRFYDRVAQPLSDDLTAIWIEI